MNDVAMPLRCSMLNLIDLRIIGKYTECQKTGRTHCGFHSARSWTTGMHNRQSIEVLLYQNCAQGWCANAFGMLNIQLVDLKNL